MRCRRRELTITQTSPTPPPSGYDLRLVPGSTTTTETLEVVGPPGATLTVGTPPQSKVLDQSGRTQVEVLPNSSQPVAVDWPASPPVDETFKLFFNFDQPREAGFSAASTNPIFRSYLQNAPIPPDQRFSSSVAPNRTPPPKAPTRSRTGSTTG